MRRAGRSPGRSARCRLDAAAGTGKKAPTAGLDCALAPACVPKRLQRVAMYIVISKPKRMSLACGVSHFMT
jgi:hypothetical protein